MNATITLAETAREIGKDGVARDVSVKHRYVNLLYAFLAVHDSRSHDADKISFCRDDGLIFTVNLSVHHITFGKENDPEESRLWDTNVDIGTIEVLLLAFVDGRDEVLRQHDWGG